MPSTSIPQPTSVDLRSKLAQSLAKVVARRLINDVIKTKPLTARPKSPKKCMKEIGDD